MLNENDLRFLERAVELARQAMEAGHGGPFGCLVAKGGHVLAEGTNMVVVTSDPTAHAEIVAIRKACHSLNSFQLDGCDIFCSCEPCPMCLGAIYWARAQRVIFANTRQDAAAIDFDDDLIYREIEKTILQRKIPFIHHPLATAKRVFEDWRKIDSRLKY